MHATLIRRQLGGLVPPKIATPNLVVGILPRFSPPIFPDFLSASQEDLVLDWDLL